MRKHTHSRWLQRGLLSVVLAGALGIVILEQPRFGRNTSGGGCVRVRTAQAAECHNTLQEALQAAGDQYVVIEIPTGQHEVASDVTVGETITLEFLKGGVLDIASGATLTIDGEIEAGTNRILGGEGKVRLHPKVEVDPVWFTSSGDGTAANPWVGPRGQGGIGEAISRVQGAKIFRLTPGDYLVTETIRVASSGVAIAGRTETLTSEPGSAARIRFEPSSSQILFEFDDGDSQNGTLDDCSLIGVALTSNGSGWHTAVRVVDAQWFVMRVVGMKQWHGVGIEWQGREKGVFERLDIEATRPIVINNNPRYPSVDCDSVVFRNASLRVTRDPA